MNIDHRRGTAFAPGDLTAYIRATWDLAPDFSIYIEAVHRLSDLGAVVTHAAHGTSQEGFDAEWRMINSLTVEGDLINRCEIFDEADLDAALASFDELSRPAPRLENAASQVHERLGAYFAARDWDAISQIIGRRLFQRRSPSGRQRRGPTRSGCRRSPTCERSPMSGRRTSRRSPLQPAETRVALCRTRAATSGPEAFHVERSSIVEIDADHRIVAGRRFRP